MSEAGGCTWTAHVLENESLHQTGVTCFDIS